MKLAISVCATKSYTYAMQSQARRVSACIANTKIQSGDVIIVGDDSKQIDLISDYWKKTLPDGWSFHVIKDKSFVEGGENYKNQAQLLIAAMRTAAHAKAMQLQVDFLWSLDSDTLPHANALRSMLDTLNFDGGYYSVVMCPYPNTAFLGGRGTIRNQIAEDFTIEERQVPERLKRVFGECEKRLKGERVGVVGKTGPVWKDFSEGNHQTPRQLLEKEDQRMGRLRKKIKECPPIGNVFFLNSKKWRKRGWLENAYPALGKGAIVPTDWVGFGCTLMDKKALNLAYFEGYDGNGTEDLYIGWNRWYPNGIKMAVLPHCPADHVIWAKKKGGSEKEYTLYNTFHESEGEFEGHLRIRESKWIQEKTA